MKHSKAFGIGLALGIAVLAVVAAVVPMYVGKFVGDGSGLTNLPVAAQVWTNYQGFIFPAGQTAPDVVGRTLKGPSTFFSPNGSLFQGTNVAQDLNLVTLSVYKPLYAVSMVDSNEPNTIDMQMNVIDSENYGFFGLIDINAVGASGGSVSTMTLTAQNTGKPSNQITISVDGVQSGDWFEATTNSVDVFAVDKDGIVTANGFTDKGALLIDDSTPLPNLPIEVKTNGTDILTVSKDGAVVANHYTDQSGTAGSLVAYQAANDLGPTNSVLGFFPTETANTVFAGPASGSAAAPAFRALTANDINGTLTNSTSGQAATVASIATNKIDITNVTNTETANTVFAGPASGAAAAPGFRALSPADIPTIGTSAFGSPLPGFIHFAAFTPYPTVAAPLGVGSQWSQSGQLQFNATATTAAFVQYNTATTNSQVGFGDSSSVIPGPWTAGLTLNVHAVVAITNIATQRTVIGFTSQISPSSPTQLSSVDAPLVGTNALYIMASTNNSHWQLVTSDGSGSSTTTPSTVALANNTLVTLDLVGSTPSGSYVMYINGTPAATNSTHLPIASIPIAFVTSGRFYIGQYGLNIYGMAIWQAFQ